MAVVNNRNVDKASSEQAKAATDDTTYMTPAKTKEAIQSNAGSPLQSIVLSRVF